MIFKPSLHRVSLLVIEKLVYELPNAAAVGTIGKSLLLPCRRGATKREA
jgi:hypothetical protein